MNRHVTLRLPSLPLHLALLASRSLALAAALARALLLHLPLLLLGTSRPLKSREPKRRERERELVSPRKGSSPLLPHLALNPPSSSHIRLCPVALRFSDPRFGRPAGGGSGSGTKTGFFRPWRRGLIRSGPGGGVASSPGLIRIGSNDLGGLIGWFRFRRGIGARAVVSWPAGGFVGLGLVRSWGLLVQHTSRRSV